MARTVEGARLTRAHRHTQLQLRARTLRDLLVLWPLFRTDDFDSFDRFAAIAALLVAARHRDSAGLGAGYFEQFRRSEQVTGTVTPEIVEPPPADVIRDKLRATGVVGVLTARRAGQSLQAARRNGFVKVTGAVGKLVLDGGRATIMRSGTGDRQLRGWQRITGTRPCHFCAMLASRGPVFSRDTTDFRAHDHDACVPEPVYEGSLATARNARLAQLWEESTDGLSGPQAVQAFRRAHEGRPIEGDPIATGG